MDSPTFSLFDNASTFQDFQFDASTPVARKKIKNTDSSVLNCCNITSEFLNDSFEEIMAKGDFSDRDDDPLPLPFEECSKPDKKESNESFSIFLSQKVKDYSSPKSLKSHNQFPTPANQSYSSTCHSQNNSISEGIIEKLKQNTSITPNRLLNMQVKRTSLLFGLDDAQKLQEQLSQTSVGPFFGLPSKMLHLLKTHKGIEELYPWQHECLLLPAVKKKQNLIYSLPTSGGKTLVAEILILRELLCYFKDAILVLPYISLVQEKVRGLAPFAVDLDFVIEECAGIKGTIPPRKRRKRHTLYICTIEKAHSLVNSMIENKRMDEIGLMVVDELHMIGEPGGRGAVLESLLAKVIFTKLTQIIGMSATLSNMSDLRQFLSADLYEKNFRPIELKEFVKVEDELYELTNKEWNLARKLNFGYTKDMLRRDPDGVTGLVMEVIPEHSCLVFCPTKKHCENVARVVCQLLPSTVADHKRDEKELILKQLKDDGNGNICEILEQSIKYGVAYHHSGLTMDERKLIEEAYLNGTLCCLACTSTLAAGVNLPAKRVILRAPYVGIEFLTYSRYKQMIGRAGRAGIDISGESILMIKNSERINAAKLLTSDMDSCQSNFITEPDRLHTLLLSLIGLGIATNMSQIHSFMERTLASVQNRSVGCSPSSVFDTTIQNLISHNLLQYEKDATSSFVITDLGRATFRGQVDISTMEEFIRRLKLGLNGLVLHSYLHLLYLVTPAEFSSSVSFSVDIFYHIYSNLSADDVVAAEQIGISERMVMLMASGRSSAKNQTLLHHFYLTLILYDLWNQNSVWDVARKFQVHRGVVQNLLNSTSALSVTLCNFCQELKEFWAYQQLLPNFVKQLSYCVTMELIPLMELPAVKRGRAKQLFTAGFKTLTDIARAKPRDLVEKVVHLTHRAAHQIVSAAKMIVMEKAEALHEEAELMMEEFDKNFTFLNDAVELPTNIGQL